MIHFDDQLGTTNQAVVELAVDYAVRAFAGSPSGLALFFHPGLDTTIVESIAPLQRSEGILLGELQTGDADTGPGLILADGTRYASAGETVLLVMKHSFYGLSRERAEALVASLPHGIEAVVVIDQIDGYANEASQVLTLRDNGGREYEAECHDFRNLFEAVGFLNGFGVALPDPVKSLSGLVLAARTPKLSFEALLAHQEQSVERMRQQAREALLGVVAESPSICREPIASEVFRHRQPKAVAAPAASASLELAHAVTLQLAVIYDERKRDGQRAVSLRLLELTRTAPLLEVLPQTSVWEYVGALNRP